MLLRAVAVGHERRQARTIGGVNFNDDPFAHACATSGILARQLGLLRQILPNRAIQSPENIMNVLDAAQLTTYDIAIGEGSWPS